MRGGRLTGAARRLTPGRADLATLLAASAALCWRFLVLHEQIGPHLALSLEDFTSRGWFPSPDYAWQSWWDQRYYLEAALAWSRGVLDPARHWYLPGYPLLGGLFARVTPADPFLVPDLACLLASLWLFASLGARLLAPMRRGRAAAALVFAAAALWPRGMWAWVVPWSTTPETACVLACLLAASRCAERRSARDAFAAALAGTAVAAFRPADAAVVMLAAGCAVVLATARARPGRLAAGRVAAAAAAGAAIPALAFGGAYLAVNGWAANGYLDLSGRLGFEWRLLPVRWVTLMIDPRPMFPSGPGLAGAFPWVVPGLAGMAAALLAPGRRGLHAMVVCAALGDCVLFLAYRDLHQPALWRLGNYHYFKWMLPVFALYALVLARALASGPRLQAAGALAGTVAGLAMWRVELAEPTTLARASDPQRLELPSGLSRMDDAVFARATGDVPRLYQATNSIESGGAAYASFFDYKVFAWFDEIMAIPIRPMPPLPGTLLLPYGVALDTSVAPVMARQTLVWGVPCLVAPRRWACRFHDPLPAPALAPGSPIRFGEGGGAEPYLRDGWSHAEAGGRWTDGALASLAFRLGPVPPGESPEVAVTAGGFVPPGGRPAHVTAFAGGRAVGRWSFPPGLRTERARIPPEAVGPDGSVALDIRVDNPRRPADSGLFDERALGIFVEQAEVVLR